VALVRTDILEERTASIITVKAIGELATMLAITTVKHAMKKFRFYFLPHKDGFLFTVRNHPTFSSVGWHK
jgi:hypothetical protein